MIIFRYLCKELYTHLLAITCVLLIVFISNQFIHYLGLVATGQLTMTAVMKIMALQVPLLLGYLLPLGLYLSILLVLGRLYLDREMTVLNACGVSKLKLLNMILIFGFLLTLVVGWLMMWVEPILEEYRAVAIQEAIQEGIMDRILPRQFQSLGKFGVFYTTYIRKTNHEMDNIFLALNSVPTLSQNDSTNPTQAWDITVAQLAQAQHDANGSLLILKNGLRYIGSAGKNDFQSMKFGQYGIRIANPKLTEPQRYDDLPTIPLMKLAKSDPKAAAMLQWRMAMPISVIIFIFLAVPLSHVNPRLGKFARLLPAIIIYTIYADLLFVGRAWIEKGTVSPALGLWWLHGAAFLLALILIVHDMKWLRLWRRKPT